MKTEGEIRAEERERVASVFQKRGDKMMEEAGRAKEKGWDSIYNDLRSQAWKDHQFAQAIRAIKWHPDNPDRHW